MHAKLWAESLGKVNVNGTRQALTPIGLVGPVDQHSFLQLIIDGVRDKTVTFIKIDDLKDDASIPKDGSNRFDGEILNISSNKALTLQAVTDLIANRSKKILGFRPSIRFNQSKSHSSFQPLFISNNKLLKFGFVVETDITSEIDRLLLNCKKWFAQ